MFSPIKAPLQRLARRIRAKLRHYWKLLIDAENKFRSWFETTILPIWIVAVEIWKFIKRIFRSKPKEAVIDETTPLLGEDARANSNTDRGSVRFIPVNVRSGVPVRPLEIRVNPIFNLSHDPLPPEIFYYSVEPYCVLCRKSFHNLEDSPDADSTTHWDRRFLAICPAVVRSSQRYMAVKLEKTEDDEMVVAPIGMEQNPPMLANLHIVTPTLPRKGLKFPPQVPQVHLLQEAYAVHRTCRSLVASAFKDQPVHRLISQFGQSTKYLSRTWCCENVWHGSLRSLAPLFSNFDPSDELAKVLRQMCLLPVELEDQIRDLSENKMLSNIINFRRTTLPLIESMNETGSRIEYLHFKLFKYLASHTLEIYDSSYLDSLTLHPRVEADSISSAILTQGIQGIQIALGDYGIGVEGLKILYHDGTSSACIGRTTNGPFITMVGRNISGLKILRDNLKITAVELMADKVWYLKYRPAHWTSACLPQTISTQHSYMIPSYTSFPNLPFPGWRTTDQKSRTKRNFNTWQAGSYISLSKNTSRVKSITVYSLNNSISGIVFHEKKNVDRGILGVRNPLACAIHLELTHDERIVNVLAGIDAIKMEGYWGRDRCPSLIFTTTLARTLVCHPMTTTQVDSKSSKYLKIHNSEKKVVSGIFADGTTNPDGSIRNLGATFSDPLETDDWTQESETQETETQETGTQEIQQPTKFPTTVLPESWPRAFISTATFQDVKRISICKRGDRVIGMRIRRHSDLPTEILGQFDPSFRSEISNPYKSKRDGPLRTITFLYKSKPKIGWGDAACEYVHDVEIQAGSLVGTEKFEGWAGKKFVLIDTLKTKSVEWLFTPTSDCVRIRIEDRQQKIEIQEGEGGQRELLLNPGIDLPERDCDPGFVLWDEHEGEGSDGGSDGDED